MTWQCFASVTKKWTPEFSEYVLHSTIFFKNRFKAKQRFWWKVNIGFRLEDSKVSLDDVAECLLQKLNRGKAKRGRKERMICSHTTFFLTLSKWVWTLSESDWCSPRICKILKESVYKSMQNIKIFFEFLKESPKKPQKMSSGSEMWSKSKTKNSHY